MRDPLVFFNPWEDIQHSRSRLPHWQQPGATYFVSFHLGDALPRELLDRWTAERKAWLAWHPEPWSAQLQAEYHQRFSNRLEQMLDSNHGSCRLRDPAGAAVVAEALAFFDGTRYSHHAWVVMPNHVHALFSLAHDVSLPHVIQTWKSVSARRLGGPVWQKDYRDRLIRNEEHFVNCVRYIRRNPVKARLRVGEYALFESEFARSFA